MSEKLTRVRLRNTRHVGLMEWGEISFEDAVAKLRANAQRELERAQAILAATDADFDVAVVRGPYVQHFVKAVEPAHQTTPPRNAS